MPNVIKCYDIGVKGELYYLVLEYVQGTDLHKVVRDKGPSVIRSGGELHFSGRTRICDTFSRTV